MASDKCFSSQKNSAERGNEQNLQNLGAIDTQFLAPRVCIEGRITLSTKAAHTLTLRGWVIQALLTEAKKERGKDGLRSIQRC